MEDTHTNKKTNQLQDGRAKLVLAASNMRKEEMRLSQSIDGESSTEIGRDKVNEIVYEVIILIFKYSTSFFLKIVY